MFFSKKFLHKLKACKYLPPLSLGLLLFEQNFAFTETELMKMDFCLELELECFCEFLKCNFIRCRESS